MRSRFIIRSMRPRSDSRGAQGRAPKALVVALSVLTGLVPFGTRAGDRPAIALPAAVQDLAPGYVQGTPWMGERGKTETVAAIMERQRRTPRRTERIDLEGMRDENSPNRHGLPQNPLSPAVASFPAGPKSADGGDRNAPQTPSTQFEGANFEEISAWPPDSQGAVGPTQYLAGANFRLRTINKNTGVADGKLNVDADVFFASVIEAGCAIGCTTDPRVRYDRLSQRWFIMYITTRSASNRIVLAVSSGPNITSSSSFTFFQFQHDIVSPPGDAGLFADYETLGVDANALYVGVNDFGQFYVNSSAFVIRKSSVLGAGPIVVTAFRGLSQNGFVGGMFTPQGVDNDDPSATEGYFLSVTFQRFGELTLRKISNPGGTPAMGPAIAIPVPTTSDPILVPHKNPSGANNNPLDALDDRLFMASMHNGTLWAAHNIQVNSSGVASASGGRDGSRWYQVAVSPSSASLVQSGTLFDSAASNPKSYWMPSVAVSGQGHMALGVSVAGSNDFVNAATAGRLAGDPLGTIRTPAVYTNSTFRYNPQNVGASVNRWGDYSQTVVDPEDNMTMWTIQEYVQATDSYATRAVKLLAPSPATPSSASPSVVPVGQSSVNVVITGTSANGSGFYDPGAGFTKHIAGAVGGGVTVNSVTYSTPTSVTLNVSTVGATPGAQNVTITNPDGQASTGVGVLTVSGGSGPAATLTPSSHGFGNQAVGTTSTPQTFTFTSTGSSAVTVAGVSLSGVNTSDFAIASNACAGAVLATNQSCTVGVTFSPSANGARAATLNVASDAANSPHTSALNGTGITPDTVPPSQVTGLVGQPADMSAQLSWNAATDNVGVDHYVVYRDGIDVSHVTSTSVTITGLANGTPYSFEVAAVDLAGNEGARSAPVSVIPEAPRDFFPGWSQFHADQAHTGYAPGAGAIAKPGLRQVIPLGLDPAASPLVVDLDGDGGSDVLAVTKQESAAGATKIFAFRQVLGTLQPAWSYTFTSAVPGGVTKSWANLGVGDLDADGDPEVVGYYGSLRDAEDNGLFQVDGQLVVLNGQTGAVIASMGPSDLWIALDTAPAIGDVDGDGTPEIVVTRFTAGAEAVVAGATSGAYVLGAGLNGSTLTKKFDTRFSATQPTVSPALADLRPDSGKEIVIGEDVDNANGRVNVCSPSATAANCSESVATTTGVKGLAIADLTGDGLKEIVANGRTAQSLAVIKTSPTLAIGATRADGFLWNTPSLADVDLDGIADIVNVGTNAFINDTAHAGDVTLRGYNGTTNTIILKGTLARTPPAGTSFEAPGGGVLTELTGDGRPDLVFGSEDASMTAVTRGPSTPVVLWRQPVPGNPVAAPAVGDVTGDGANDIIGATSDGKLLVISQNRPPVTPGGSVTTNEDTSARITLSGSDPDVGDVLTFTITALPAQGALYDSASPVDGTGHLITASELPYQLTSADVRYEPSLNSSGSDSFAYRVGDGKDTTPASIGLSVTPVEDAPVAHDQTATVGRNLPKVLTLTGSDPDPADSLVFKIASLPANGRLFDGTSTSAHEIAATELPYTLGSNKVTYLPDTGYTGSDLFRFRANDGQLDSVFDATVTLDVTTAVNGSPTANDGSGSTVEDTPVDLGLTGSDPEGEQLVFTIRGLPAHGSLKDGSAAISSVPAELSGSTVTYTPAANYNGPDSFTFSANDGTSDSNTATMSLSIAPANDAPTATPQSATLPRDEAKSLWLLGNDVDGGAVSFSIDTLPQHGTLHAGTTSAAPAIGSAPYALSNSRVTYVPAAGYTGPDSFTFRSHDASTSSTPATVSLTVLAPTTTRVRPSTMGFWQFANTGTSAQGSFVYGPATPPAGGGSVLQVANTGDKQTLQTTDANGMTLAGIHLAYSTYTTTSTGSTPLTASLNVSVDRTGDQQSDETLVFEPYEQASFGAGPATVMGAWQTWDASAGKWWSTATGPGGPRFTLAEYVARPGNADAKIAFLSQAAFRVVVGSSGASWPNFSGNVDRVVLNGTVFNFDPDNSAPVAASQSVSTVETTPKTVTLSATDADLDPLTYIVTSLPANGSLKDGATAITAVPRTLSGSTVTYTANAGYAGPDAFGFKANDGTVDSNTATVNVTVEVHNTAPTATAQSFSASEDTEKPLVLTGSDPDLDALAFKVVSLPANGSLYDGASSAGHKILAAELPYTLASSAVTYLGASNFNGSDSFTFKVNDGEFDSVAATASGTIAAVNDAPTAADINVGTGQDTPKTITLAGTDVDGQTLSFKVVSLPAHGSLFDGQSTASPAITTVPYATASNKVTYRPNAGYIGSDAFTFKANDGVADSANTGTVTLGVADTVAPDTQITSGPSGTTTSTTAVISFTASEPGATFECKLDNGTFAACTSPVALAGLGDGLHTFVVRALDGTGNADPTPAARQWTVDTKAPDTLITSGPSGTINSASAAFGFTATETTITFACAIDGGSFAACTSPKSYTGLADGPHTFAVRATDGAGNADPSPAQRTWTIDTAAPGAPQITSPLDGSIEPSSLVTVAGTAEPSALVRVFKGAAQMATVSVGSSGTWSVKVPLPNGTHVLTAKATDPAGNTGPSSAAVTIEVADTEAPSSPSITTPTAGAVVPPTAVTVAGSGEPGTTIRVLEGATVLGTTTVGSSSSWSMIVSLQNGNHTIAATATDPAGNVSDASASVAFRVGQVDTGAPTVTITTVALATSTVAGTAADSVSGVEQVVVTFTGSGDPVVRTATCPACRPDARSVTWTVPVAGLSPGVYTVTVQARDVAGNLSAPVSTQLLIIPGT